MSPMHLFRHRRRAAAFSLLEVVIATGIFALAVTVILALLPALVRQAGNSADTLTALRLPDAVALELQRMAAAGSFNALAAQAGRMTAPLPATLQLVASRNDGRVQALDYLPPTTELLPAADQYFLIEIWQFAQPSLAFDASGAGLALHVRVSWPYRLPGSAAITPALQREQVAFNLSLNR